MALKIIVSYDDTDNDRDALALGRLLAFSGARALARLRPPLRSAARSSRRRPRSCWPAAPASVGAPDMPRHVVVNPGTSVGLTELAERENADVIVFGSEYRTAPGLVKPGISAHKLLLGGPAAIAVAPAGLHANPSVSVNTVGVIDEGDADRARRPPRASPRRSAPSVAEHGSRPGRPARRRLAAGGAGRARSSSAPPATTRSRPRPTRCW